MRRFSRGPNTIFEYRPGMSVGDMGGSFSRTSVGTYVDADGFLQSAASGIIRDGHFINGVRSLLLEPARTNSVLWSRDVTQATWQRNFLTATKNAVGCDGVANAANTCIEDTSNNAHFTRQVNGVTITSGATQSIYVVIKGAGRTKGSFYLQSTAPTTNDRFGVNYDLVAGTLTSFVQGAGVTLRFGITALANGFFLIWATGTLGTSTAAVNVVRLADGSGNLTYVGDGVSGVILDYQGHEVDQVCPTSPITTSATTVTRSADLLLFPFGSGPVAMTSYVKFVELGSIYSNTVLNGGPYVWSISSGSSPTIETWRLEVANGGPFYRTRHVSTAAGVNCDVTSPVPAYGNVVELRAQLFSNGSIQLGQCVNGSAEVLGTQSGAAAFDADWSARSLNVSGQIGSSEGPIAIQALRFLLGAQSMATMQYDFYTAITSDSAEFVHLIELQFSGGTQRLCTGAQDIAWNGLTWQNVGGLLSIGGIEETSDSKGQGVDLKLSGVDQTVLSALLSNSYRGRPVTIWRAHLNRTTGVIVGDPAMLFSGLQLSPYTVEEQRDMGGGVVTVSTRISGYFGVERVRGIQTNVTSHSHVYNGDTFFQNCATLQNKKIYWGTPVPQTPGMSGGSSVGGETSDPGNNKFKP